MEARPSRFVQAFGWFALVGLALASVVLGRLVYDFFRVHAAIGVAVALFFAGFLAVVGPNVMSLVRGAPPADPVRAWQRIALALAVPVALLAAVLDCMGLDFIGCTRMCEALMRGVAPAVSLLILLYALTGWSVWIACAGAVALTLLVPNCVCRNPINRGWIAMLGQSPACYASGFAVFLLSSTALATRRRVAWALALAWGIVVVGLLFWYGHHYHRIPW
jgi:hypothetical protein